MKNIKILGLSTIVLVAVFSFAAIFVNPGNVEAQVIPIVCPEGYVCTPVEPVSKYLNIVSSPVIPSRVTTNIDNQILGIFQVGLDVGLPDSNSNRVGTISSLDFDVLINGVRAENIDILKDVMLYKDKGTTYVASAEVSYNESGRYPIRFNNLNEVIRSGTSVEYTIKGTLKESSSTNTSVANGNTIQLVFVGISGTTINPVFSSVSLSSLTINQIVNSCYTFTSNLQLGSSGQDVTALQNLLISKGYSISEGVTGYFGRGTYAAVKAYQKANGIPYTGFVGPLTRIALNAECSVTPNSSMTFFNPTQWEVVKTGAPYMINWGGLWSGSDTFSITEFNDYGKSLIISGITQQQAGCPGYGKGICSYRWTPQLVSSKYQLAVEKQGSNDVAYSGSFSTASSTTSGLVWISNTSALLGTAVVDSNGIIKSYPVSFKFTLTAGNYPIYLGVYATSFTAKGGSITPIKGGITANPANLPGDSLRGFPSDYYIISPGTSRQFTSDGILASLASTYGNMPAQVTSIQYGTSTSNLNTHSITSGLGNLVVMALFNGTNTQSTPSITILSPNGGETYSLGQTMTMKWLSQGLLNQPEQALWTGLEFSSGAVCRIGSISSYVSSINLGLIEGYQCPGTTLTLGAGQYKAIVFLEKNPEIKDTSNGYVTITRPNSTNKPPIISGGTSPTLLKVNETGTWTVNASDPENGPLSYSINWGDGGTNQSSVSSAAKPIIQTSTFTHSYSSAGTYTVTFTVTDNAGLTAKTSSTVQVSAPVNPPPQSTPSITILSPNGGETLSAGRSYNLRLKIPSDKQYIVSYYYIPKEGTLIRTGDGTAYDSNINGYSGGSTWQNYLSPELNLALILPKDIYDGNYKLRVYLRNTFDVDAYPDYSKAIASDESDSYFTVIGSTIVQPPPPPPVTPTNLITTLSQGSTFKYDTFNSSGNNITLAIESTANIGGAVSNRLTLDTAKQYEITYTLNLNSGTAPNIRYVTGMDGRSTIQTNSSGTRALDHTARNGTNSVTFTPPTGTGYIEISVGNGYKTDFSMSDISLKEIAQDLPMASQSQTSTIWDAIKSLFGIY